MAANRWQRVVAVLCVASFVLTSCTSLQTVAIPSGASPPSLPEVKVGDAVVVTTKTRKRKAFTVTAVESDALAGKDVRVAYADMETLEVKHFRKGGTIALVIVLAVVVLSAVAIDSTHEAIHEIFSQPAN